MKRETCFATALLILLCASDAMATTADDFHRLQDQLDSSILDAYSGTASVETSQSLNLAWKEMLVHADDPEVRPFVPADFSFQTPAELARKIGTSRARLEHIVALEMLAHQRQGEIEQARLWRDMLTLPKFANANLGALLLQKPLDQARQESVTQALAREYVDWKVDYTKELLEELDKMVSSGEGTTVYTQAKLAEIETLTQFPASILQWAEVDHPAAPVAPISPDVVVNPADPKAGEAAFAAWREKVEAALPVVKSNSNRKRLERLLARCIFLIPKEYQNGAPNRQIVVPNEYKDAVQFAGQAQSLVDELAPGWQRDQPDVFEKYRGDLALKLTSLHGDIEQLETTGVVDHDAQAVADLLSTRFGLSAHHPGEKIEFATFPKGTIQPLLAPSIPPDASPEQKEFLENRMTLSNNLAQVHNQALTPGANTGAPSATELAEFKQQNAALLARQVVLAGIIAQQRARMPAPMPPPLRLPPNATPQLQAYLASRDQLLRAHVQMMNECQSADPSTRAKVMADWQKKTAALVDEMKRQAQQLNQTKT